MHPDPVVEEIRRNAEKIAEECGYDVHRMAERFRRGQEAHRNRVVSRGRSFPPPSDEPPPKE